MTQTETAARPAEPNPAAAPSTDAELVDAIAARDRDALEAVFVAHSPFLYGLACRMCGPTLAGDIVATVLVDFWIDPSRFQPDEGSLARYLHMATHRQAVHLLHERGARRTHDGADLLLKLSSEGLSVNGDAVQRVVGESSAVRLAVLTEDERNVIVLAYFGGYTCTELAALLGQTDTQVTSLINSGLRRLRSDIALASATPAVSAAT